MKKIFVLALALATLALASYVQAFSFSDLLPSFQRVTPVGQVAGVKGGLDDLSATAVTDTSVSSVYPIPGNGNGSCASVPLPVGQNLQTVVCLNGVWRATSALQIGGVSAANNVGVGMAPTNDKLSVAGTIMASSLAGTGNAYVCVNASGVLFRSATPCGGGTTVGGLTVSNFVATSPILDQGLDATTTDDRGIFTSTFDVTAQDNTAWVSLSANRGTSVAGGVSYYIETPSNNDVPLTTGIAGAALERVSGGSMDGNYVRINDGQTVKFRLNAAYDPAVAGVYRVQIHGVNYNPNSASAPTNQALVTPTSSFQSDSLPIQN